MTSVNLNAPKLSPLFTGRSLASVLADRHLAGMSAAPKLEPEAFAGDNDPAGSILAAIDLTLPTIQWEAPQVRTGITSSQRVITITSYPVIGDSRALTWVSNPRQIGTPPARFGLSDGRLTIVCESAAPDRKAAAKAVDQVRRHINANQVHAIAQRDTWRGHSARQIRAAVTARATLIVAITYPSE